MIGRRVVWLAYAAWVLVALSIAVFPALEVAAGHELHATPVLDLVALFVAFLGMATLGVLIVRRDRRNAIGWIFCASPLLMMTGNVTGAYAEYALLRNPRAPGGMAAAVLGSLWLPGATLFVAFLALLFPDGRLPSHRWRPVGWLGAVSYAVVMGVSTLRPGPFDQPLKRYDNPIGIAFPSALGAAYPALLVVTVCGIAAAVLRYRGGDRVRREQLRWFVGAALATAVLACAALATRPLFGIGLPDFVFLSFFWLVPAAVGIAILRYRLYEIDVIIRRTLIYATLVAVLAVVYLAGVYVIGSGLQAVTGQSGALAVTLSTLAVAAAFQPLRRRIQRLVDRRFYRANYDAARTLAAFSGRLREQIDLDALDGEILAAVHETLRPSHASLWLRHGDARLRRAGAAG